MMMVPRGGKSHVQAQAYGGVDAFLLPMVPRPWRLRIIAWKILRHFQFPKELSPGSLTFSLPGENLVYEITDPKGHVRPFKPAD